MQPPMEVPRQRSYLVLWSAQHPGATSAEVMSLANGGAHSRAMAAAMPAPQTTASPRGGTIGSPDESLTPRKAQAGNLRGPKPSPAKPHMSRL